MADDPTRGLYEKYSIARTDGKPVGPCIVLELDDPNSLPAIATFADTVEAAGYGLLAGDLRRLVAQRVR